eukprot:TRINITY_DN12337_c0_g1_i1.p1 TRINITY_DN12337_c0_g1~~TRINITY_DN12337_c0_g1_i1.p1  ORF type:complete len:329 (-),score=75.51 TRINITY_DN12337_c0_g1_i1:508-1494(-)
MRTPDAAEASPVSKGKKRARSPSISGTGVKKAPTWKATIDYETLHSLLVSAHGAPPKPRASGDSLSACGRKALVVDACVALILSQNTSNGNSMRALASLKAAFPDGADAMLAAGEDKVEAAIRCGGLSNMKAKRIIGLLQAVKGLKIGNTAESSPTLSLEHLRALPTDEARRVLTALPGLGPKSVSCVLAFTLDRADLPVDTHVHRVATRVGLAPPRASREATYAVVNDASPPQLRHDLHVLMIQHGNKVCTARRDPNCSSCPLTPHCAYFNNVLKKAASDSATAEGTGREGKNEAGAGDGDAGKSRAKKRASGKGKSKAVTAEELDW